MKLLLCEDEITLSKVLTTILKKNNYTVDCAYDGSMALDFLKMGFYDAVILDVMMPKLDGFSVLKEMRMSNNNTPVIMLTAKSQLDDKLNGFNLGCDDYLTKPFASSELLARLKAIIRRKEGIKDSYIEYNGVKLNTDTYKISYLDKEESLQRKEYQLLEIFMSNPNIVISLDSLLLKIYSYNDGDITTLWVYISYIRKKLKNINASITIKSIRNAGYILEKL